MENLPIAELFPLQLGYPEFVQKVSTFLTQQHEIGA
jgi:hypothetical protein